MQDNNVELILAFVNIKDKELIGFLIVICPAVLVQDIFVFVIFESEFLEVYVLHDFPSFIEFDACINLFGESIHFISGGFLFLVVSS